MGRKKKVDPPLTRFEDMTEEQIERQKIWIRNKASQEMRQNLLMAEHRMHKAVTGRLN